MYQGPRSTSDSSERKKGRNVNLRGVARGIAVYITNRERDAITAGRDVSMRRLNTGGWCSSSPTCHSNATASFFFGCQGTHYATPALRH